MRTMPRPEKKIVEGVVLCCWCDKPTPKGMRKYCSADCRMQVDVRVRPHVMRWYVEQRDREVCALCHCDLKALKRVLRHLSRGDEWSLLLGSAARFILGLMGFNPDSALWEADHIVPISEGGDLGPENVRTLCVPCHKGETAKLSKRRAKVARLTRKEAAHQQQMALRFPWQ